MSRRPCLSTSPELRRSQHTCKGRDTTHLLHSTINRNPRFRPIGVFTYYINSFHPASSSPQEKKNTFYHKDSWTGQNPLLLPWSGMRHSKLQLEVIGTKRKREESAFDATPEVSTRVRTWRYIYARSCTLDASI